MNISAFHPIKWLLLHIVLCFPYQLCHYGHRRHHRSGELVLLFYRRNVFVTSVWAVMKLCFILTKLPEHSPVKYFIFVPSRHLLSPRTTPPCISFLASPVSTANRLLLLSLSHPLLSSELLLSQSNVCVCLINSEALLITATGSYVAWMVTCWLGPGAARGNGATVKPGQGWTMAWLRPGKQLVLF